MIKSLKEFPGSFDPLVIVTGDRRELPPQTTGDVLAYSVSSTDTMYLPALGLQSSRVFDDHGLIVSDKQFVTDSEDKLRHRFGNTNILVIGSPAVNLLARRINDFSSFRFEISETSRKELQEQEEFMRKYVLDEDDLFIYHQCLDGVIDAEAILYRFADQDPQIDALRSKAKLIVPAFKKTLICQDLHANPRPIRYLLHKLDQPGIYDSLSSTVRGNTIGPNKDYGLISIMRNPFCDSEDYHLIYVAGVHGPGTAMGVKLLQNKKNFIAHPFGGVYEVSIARFADYYEKINQSKPRWETHPYDVEKYIKTPKPRSSMQAFLSSPGGKNDSQQQSFNHELKNLLADTFLQESISLRIECSYTLVPCNCHNFG